MTSSTVIYPGQKLDVTSLITTTQGTGNLPTFNVGNDISFYSFESGKFLDFVRSLPRPYPDAIETCLNAIENCRHQDELYGTNSEELIETYRKMIVDQLFYLSDPDNMEGAVELDKLVHKISLISDGAMEAFGGATEALLGLTVAAGATASVVGIGLVAGGAYLVADGLNSTIEGGSKLYNATLGDVNANTVNFLRDEIYSKYIPGGQTTYSISQIITGLVCITNDLNSLNKATTFKPRLDKIKQAVANGEKIRTKVIQYDGNVYIKLTSAKTRSILNEITIDTSKLNFSAFSLAVDSRNAISAADATISSFK